MEIRSDRPFRQATDTYQSKVMRKVCAACAHLQQKTIYNIYFLAQADALRKQQNVRAGDSITRQSVLKRIFIQFSSTATPSPLGYEIHRLSALEKTF